MQKRPWRTVKHEHYYRNYLARCKWGEPHLAIYSLIEAVYCGRKIDLAHFLKKHQKEWEKEPQLKVELITAVLRQRAGG